MSLKPETPSARGCSSDPCDTLFREVFNRIQTGIFLIDPDTHTIVGANPIAEEILSAPKDHLINRMCHDFICPSKEGTCPATRGSTPITNAEGRFLNQKGEVIAILKTVTRVTVNGKEFLLESFVDISDRKKAEDRKVALIGFMNESMLRIRCPLELTKMNMQLIADQVKTGAFEPEEIRMGLQIQANNISQMLKNLDDLVHMVADEQGQDMPEESREFLIGK